MIQEPPRPETISEAIANWDRLTRKRIREERARRWLLAERQAEVKAKKERQAQAIPPPPPVASQSEPEFPTGKSIGDQVEIASLKAESRAMLIAHTWQDVGFWRWERGRRSFFRVTRLGVVQRVQRQDWPYAFRPLKPLDTFPRRPKPKLDEGGSGLAPDLDAFKARIITALRVDQALRHSEREMMRVRAYPLQTSPGPGDYPPAIDTRFHPSRAELDDYEVVMAWFARLSGGEQSILWLVSFGFSIRTIAEKRKHRNAADARGTISRAVINCWRIAAETQQGGRGRARCA